MFILNDHYSCFFLTYSFHSTSQPTVASSSSKSKTGPALKPQLSDFKYERDDGDNRTRAGKILFDSGNYAMAEVLFNEAYEIFKRLHGEVDERTERTLKFTKMIREASIISKFYETSTDEIERRRKIWE